MNISKNLLKVRGSIKDAKNKLISGEAAIHIYLFCKDKTFLAEGLAYISRDLATVRSPRPFASFSGGSFRRTYSQQIPLCEVAVQRTGPPV